MNYGTYKRTGPSVLERKCHECGKPGHLRAFCPELLKCHECGQPGHLKGFCPELLGGGPGRGHSWRGRGFGRFDGRGGTCGRGAKLTGRANALTVGEEARQTVSVEMNADEWKKWCQFREMAVSDKQSMEGPPTGASSTMTNFSGKILNTECYDYCKASWLIDSRASRHMAGNHGVFSSYISGKEGQRVKLADGSSQNSLGSGIVMCNSEISLSS